MFHGGTSRLEENDFNHFTGIHALAIRRDLEISVGLYAWNIARPALFVVDRGGEIRYSFIAERQDEFPSHDEILKALEHVAPRT